MKQKIKYFYFVIVGSILLIGLIIGFKPLKKSTKFYSNNTHSPSPFSIITPTIIPTQEGMLYDIYGKVLNVASNYIEIEVPSSGLIGEEKQIIKIIISPETKFFHLIVTISPSGTKKEKEAISFSDIRPGIDIAAISTEPTENKTEIHAKEIRTIKIVRSFQE